MAVGVKTGGRQKGTANKTTFGAKANIIEVFELIGGIQGMAKWAIENQTEFYRHYSKLIPAELNANVDGDLRITSITRTIVDASRDQDS